MAYLITDECISCGACEPECPNAAIVEGETIYDVLPEKWQKSHPGETPK